MQELLNTIRQCEFCEAHLPKGARPIIEASKKSKILLISQAPGRVVHESGIAWDDQSGKKLREWLGVDEDTFYNTSNFAILPMGFCYPGKAKSGDLPPRKDCAPLWHDQVFSELDNLKLIILIGSFASNYYLPHEKAKLTEKVADFEKFLPKFWPLPHPSPVNRFWRIKNPWFEESVVPKLKDKIASILH